MIQIRELEAFYETKQGRKFVLGPISLDLNQGEFLSIVGPSGCGKSTLAKVITGIHTGFSGSIEFSDEIKTISTVFQDYGVFPWKTALENIAFAVREQGNNKIQSIDIAKFWLRRLRLEGFESYYPKELSGGMQQRLSIARALAVNPDFLVLDEPFAAIDTQLREELQEELLQLHEENKMTCLQITHNYDEALLLSDRVLAFSAAPAVIDHEIKVPFARPRDTNLREMGEFVELRKILRTYIKNKGVSR